MLNMITLAILGALLRLLADLRADFPKPSSWLPGFQVTGPRPRVAPVEVLLTAHEKIRGYETPLISPPLDGIAAALWFVRGTNLRPQWWGEGERQCRVGPSRSKLGLTLTWIGAR
jgi:hypothetical protein